MADWLKIILAIAPRAKPEIAHGLADAMPEIVSKYGVATLLDQAHFLAQTAHESDGFHTTVEYASGDAYDTRTDLGFTKAKDGDGRKHKGFGLIQTTGPTNQSAAAKALGIVAEYTKNPRILATFPWAALSAGLYWKSRNISVVANRDDVEAVTRKVNGGLNGLADRKTYLRRAKVALGIGEQHPAEADPMPRAKVKMLQTALSPVYPLGACDGKIGTLTVAAIGAFQADHGLAVTGCFDPETVAAIEQGVEPRPILASRAGGKPKGSRILSAAAGLKVTAGTMAATAVAKLADDPLSALEGASGNYQRAKTLIEPFGGLAGLLKPFAGLVDLVGAHWPVALLAFGVGVFILAHRISAARIADYRTGKNPMIRTALLALPGGSIILAVWSFATSTIGMVLIAASLAYGTGWHMATEKCDAAQLRAELATVRADLTASQNAEALARNQASDLEASDKTNRDKVNALSKSLKARTGRACGLSDDDARRLRDIR